MLIRPVNSVPAPLVPDGGKWLLAQRDTISHAALKYYGYRIFRVRQMGGKGLLSDQQFMQGFLFTVDSLMETGNESRPRISRGNFISIVYKHV